MNCMFDLNSPNSSNMDASPPTLSLSLAHPIVLAEVILAAGANQGQPMAVDVVLQSLLSSSG